jgi:hypothetical protein
LGQRVGQAAACRALGVPRASLYRSLQPVAASRPRPTPARALKPRERKTVLHHLHSERFCDKAPVEVYATLLDEGVYRYLENRITPRELSVVATFTRSAPFLPVVATPPSRT